MGARVANLLLVLGSVLFVALFAELALRFVFVQGGQPDIHRPSSRLGHELVPNLDFVHIWDARENQSRIRINAQGFRGRDLPSSAQGDLFRVLLLGDSYTFGYGVGGDATFGAVLERGLNGADHGGAPSVVINGGVSGYSTAQAMLHFEDVAAELEPDLVILNFFVGNDIQENLCLDIISLKHHGRHPCFSLEDGVLLEPSPRSAEASGKGRRSGDASAASSAFDSLRSLLKRSKFFEFIFQRGVRLLGSNAWLVRLLYAVGIEVHPGYLPHVVSGWYAPEHSARGWELTRALIRRLRDRVQAGDARLAVVVIPSRIQVLPALYEVSRVLYAGNDQVEAFFENPARPEEQILKFLAEEGIPGLDLRPVIAAAEDVEDLYFPIISHWNDRGHRIAGEAILEFLNREGLTTQPRS